MRIGVLALQGAFAEHEALLKKLGADYTEIRQKADFSWGGPKGIDGLIIPGGESTTIGKLLDDLGLMEPIREAIAAGMPVYGTCAGMILLAKKIIGAKRLYLNLMDAEVHRNAYGRQLGSFATEADFAGVGKVPMVFIRAPFIVSVSGETEVLAEVDGHIVAARERNMLATSFHPELTGDTKVHAYFLDMVKEQAGAK